MGTRSVDYSFLGPDLAFKVEQRRTDPSTPTADVKSNAGSKGAKNEHPAGEIKYSGSGQLRRVVSLLFYFLISSCT